MAGEQQRRELACPELPVEIWDRIASKCDAKVWCRGAGTACKMLSRVQPAMLVVPGTENARSMQAVDAVLRWTTRHWGSAQIVDLQLSTDTPNPWGLGQQLQLGSSLRACRTLPPLQLRALLCCTQNYDSPLPVDDIPKHATLEFLAGMPALELLSVDFPPGYTLQPLTRLRHLALDNATRLDVDHVQKLLITTADSLESLSLPAFSCDAGVDLSRFTRLRNVMSTCIVEDLSFPLGCRLHWDCLDPHTVLHNWVEASSGTFTGRVSSLAVPSMLAQNCKCC